MRVVPIAVDPSVRRTCTTNACTCLRHVAGTSSPHTPSASSDGETTLPDRRTRTARRDRSLGLSLPLSIVRSPSTRISTPALSTRLRGVSTNAGRRPYPFHTVGATGPYRRARTCGHGHHEEDPHH